MESKTIEAFNRYSEEYDRWFDGPEGRVLFQMEVEAVRLLMKDLKHPFIEIGVGTGRFAKKLGISFGVDPAINILKRAKKRGIKVVLARGENLPFKKDIFRAVFILFTLCFVESALKVIKEAKRVLRPEGIIIVGIINKDSDWGKLYLKKKTEGHPVYSHARFYNPEEIKQLLAQCGLKLKSYSSTLLQNPSENPYREIAGNRLLPGAGFVCISGEKV